MKNFGLIHELRLSGVDWDTIKDTVDWFTDNDRKLYAGWLIGSNEGNNDSDIIKNATALQTIRLERKRLGIERSINNEQIRDITLHQAFTDRVVDSIDNRYSDFNIFPIIINPMFSTRSHIFAMGDYHYNGDTSYLNVLNTATEQILRVVEEKDLKEIILIEGGDTIDGASLRNSQLMSIKKGMVNQVIEVADAYIKMLVELSKYVKVKFYSVDSSNHTQLRNLGTKQNQLIEEDLMLVFNGLIEKALPNLDFTHDKEMFVDILGFNCFIAHSHEVRGNAIKYIKDVTSHRDRLIDFSFFFHRHHMETIDINSANGYDKKLFYVPALTNQLSQFEKQNNLSSQAGIGYYVLDENDGCIETRKLLV
ncbi:MAG: hypothetical protein GQ557_01385 [Mycoplasmataceae bacterium]|nr:hypothetical protein [Mycoplasmataceae bacterium]